MFGYLGVALDVLLFLTLAGVFVVLLKKRQLKRGFGILLVIGMVAGMAFAVFDTYSVQQARRLQAQLPNAEVEWTFFDLASLRLVDCSVGVKFNFVRRPVLDLATLKVHRPPATTCTASDEELRELLSQ